MNDILTWPIAGIIDDIATGKRSLFHPGELQAEQAAEQAAAAAFQSIPPLDAAEADPSGMREAKLARAKALIADPGYPPKGVLDSVATLLANHLQPGTDD